MPIKQSKSLDKVDYAILRALQQDGRMTIADLSKQVNLSATPCAERMKSLEQRGHIKGYRAELNPSQLSLGLLVFVEISLIRTSPDVLTTSDGLSSNSLSYLSAILCRGILTI